MRTYHGRSDGDAKPHRLAGTTDLRLRDQAWKRLPERPFAIVGRLVEQQQAELGQCLWKGRSCLVDGSTTSMPDTPTSPRCAHPTSLAQTTRGLLDVSFQGSGWGDSGARGVDFP
jgi:hypothetical protein